ncbi:hypothetical protein B0H13DRAFT_2666673 [Mycena leptocephala]|nr:hypothetical protein B0H13DRAFT_2666673 [Mycena leptocephala]
MGFHLTQQLANHGAKVYLAARSRDSASQAISRIENENPSLQGQNRVVFLPLDLVPVDILIHNAALFHEPRLREDSDGIEDGFAVKRLPGSLRLHTISSPSPDIYLEATELDVRLIMVALLEHAFTVSDVPPDCIRGPSFAPAGGKFNTLEEINDPLGPINSPNGIRSRYARYARSKLAGILFIKELQQYSTLVRASARDSGVPLIGPLFRFAISKFARSPLDGAATALFAATSLDVRQGPPNSRALVQIWSYRSPSDGRMRAAKD